MMDSEIERRLVSLKPASRALKILATETKNRLLNLVADRILSESDSILSANSEDLARLSDAANVAFRDRLTLNSERLRQMADSLRTVAMLPDPVGEIVEQRTLENGLKIRRVRAPLGTILMIFESRPNVITEVFALALKSGNAIALRGGSDSKSTAAVLYRIIGEVLEAEFSDEPASGAKTGLPFIGIEDYDRTLVGHLLTRNDVFDICIPRGGSELINRVTLESKMPVIKNDKGVCHLFVQATADLQMASTIAVNAKTQRPGVCNSIETLLLERSIAGNALAVIAPALTEKGVQFTACDESLQFLPRALKADESDFYREYLDLKINVKIVAGLEEAVSHIEKYGSHHSETIITRDEAIARRFQNEVDSACVYWNASTRFTDGFALGLGGEIGISTQKLHVRGPVGLRELTSARWLIDGAGQIRN